LNFVVPIRIIREKYDGGWEQCVKDHQPLIGGRVWFDEHLFRDGAMSPPDIRELLYFWQGHGLEPFGILAGEKVWNDCCVVEAPLGGGTTLPCDWIELSEDGRAASLRGSERGELIGPEERRG
tara:strand:- start:170 stop:538 length:369 start_codon:yes stop_codon:yes gene_type:complete